MLGLALLAIPLLFVLVAIVLYLSSKLRELDDRVKTLEQRQREVIPSPPPIVTAVATVPPGRRAPSPPAEPAPVHEIASQPVAAALSPVAPPPTEPVPTTPSRTREEWEALIGGKLLNRIGALALIIGMGFFLKHAIDNQWINELTRVLIGAAVGFICLVGADRARTRGFQIFSQGLVGAGLAILYLSVYASFNFYQLVSLQAAFALMGVVTVIALLEAFRNDSLAISLLACVGGLLTPVMLSTGGSHEVGLFAYLIVLNLVMVVILFRKPSWAALEPLAMAGTYALYFSWFSTYYATEHTLPALLFIILFWALYHGLDLSRVITAQPLFNDLRRVMGWFHAALSFWALGGICVPYGYSRIALAAAIAALLYLGSALFVERRRSDIRAAATQYAVAGATFLAWAVALEFESFAIILLWTVEAMALVWLGTRSQRPYLWIPGLILFGIAALTLLNLEGSIATSSLESYRVFLNVRALTYVVLAASVCTSVILLRTANVAGATVLAEVLHYGWILLLFTLLTVEANDLFRSWMVNASGEETEVLGFARLMVMAVVWSLYALVLIRVTRRLDSRPVRFSGITLSFVAACLAGVRGIAFDPLNAFTPGFNIRVYAILLIAGVLFLETRWLHVNPAQSSWIPEIREALLIVGVALLLVLCTGETRDVFEQAIAAAANSPIHGSLQEAERLENLKQLSLSGVWLVFSIAVMVFGIWRRTRQLRMMAIVLFGITILKIFIYDLSFLETLYRIFSFLGLGLILLAVSYLYQRYRGIILGPSDTAEV